MGGAAGPVTSLGWRSRAGRIVGYCWLVAAVEEHAACRCYRCGTLLTVDTVTVDRIKPGCKGGTYRRDNIRPACGPCNSETGGGLRANPKKRVAA